MLQYKLDTVKPILDMMCAVRCDLFLAASSTSPDSTGTSLPKISRNAPPLRRCWISASDASRCRRDVRSATARPPGKLSSPRTTRIRAWCSIRFNSWRVRLRSSRSIRCQGDHREDQQVRCGSVRQGAAWSNHPRQRTIPACCSMCISMPTATSIARASWSRRKAASKSLPRSCLRYRRSGSARRARPAAKRPVPCAPWCTLARLGDGYG